MVLDDTKRAPLDCSGAAVDAKNDQIVDPLLYYRLLLGLLVGHCLLRVLPDVGVAVVATCDNDIGRVTPIDTRHKATVLIQTE